MALLVPDDSKVEALWQEVYVRTIATMSAHVDQRTPGWMAQRAGEIADAACKEYMRRTK